jgi:ArsR family transcriptional regulator
MSDDGEFENRVSRLLSLIGQPARIQILLVLSEQDACVCHLEAALGMRQSSISQHLTALREGGIVCTNREGRNMFYHLVQPEVVGILMQTALLAGLSKEDMDAARRRHVNGCECPHCNPDKAHEIIC